MKALIIALALPLAACASTTQHLTPEQANAAIKAFHDAGCGGRVDVDAGAATGQIGGEVHVTLGLHGECPSAAPATPAAPVAASDTVPH